MRHSIRFTLLLLLMPLTAVLTAAVWLIQVPALAVLDRMWEGICQQTSLVPSLCLQPEATALWSLVALATAFTVLCVSFIASWLMRYCARDLQQQLLEVQKGQRDQLADQVPREVQGLAQQINRLLSVRPGTVEPALQSHPTPATPEQPVTKPLPSAAPTRARAVFTASEPAAADDKPMTAAVDKAPTDASTDTRPVSTAPDAVPVFRSGARNESVATSKAQAAKPRQPDVEKPHKPAVTNPASEPPETASDIPAAATETKGSLPVRQIHSIIKQLEQAYPGKHFDLITELEEDCPWPTRAADLDEVLVNLLDNAGRWAHAQINIFLASKSNVLALEVADDGPGVSPDQLDHLGTPGLTLDQQSPGKGLGLATVRYIIGQYGGGLAFSISPLGGLEVLATLPRTRPALHSLGATSRHDPLATRRDLLKGAKVH